VTNLIRPFIAICLTAVLTPGLALARVHSAAAPVYQIRELTAPTGSGFYPEAINGGGEVVGELSSQGGTTDRAVVYAGHLIVVGAPPGFTDSAGLGISYMGALLVQAWCPGKERQRLVAEPRNSQYVWRRLHTGMSGYYPYSIEAIDANGDIVGDIQRPHQSGSRRAVVWLPAATGTYPRATVLPRSSPHDPTPPDPKTRNEKPETRNQRPETGNEKPQTPNEKLETRNEKPATGADTIWSGGGRIVVGGYESSARSSPVEAHIWTRAAGTGFRTASDTFGMSVEVIGGHGSQVYLAGTTGSGANYGEPISQAASPLVFARRGAGSEPSLTNLGQSGAASVYVASVSAGWPRGGFVAVGNAGRWIGAPQHAVIWRGLAGGTVYGISLRHLLSNHASWTLMSAVGINRTGEIVGTGTLRGRYAAYLLTPPQALSCACY